MHVIGPGAFVLLLAGFLGCAPGESRTVTVFAAASTANAVTDVAAAFTEETHIPVRTSFAGSSILAKQIAEGAPADIFVSANPRWMDYLVEKGSVRSEDRFDLLGNRLVLVAPTASTVAIAAEAGVDLLAALGGGKLAMGDPDHVPAGIYGRKALESLGMWAAVAPQVARAWDVRACLALVERAEAPLGIVYATDAAISEKVRIVSEFPASSHPPITYPAALVGDRPSAGARAFVDYLGADEAREAFEKFGFSVP